jgi:hypothetical protein
MQVRRQVHVRGDAAAGSERYEQGRYLRASFPDRAE